MSIKCQICGKEFPSLISSTHLKSHGVTSRDYVAEHGKDSLASAEYRQLRSSMNKGEKNPNYGNKMPDDSRRSISEKNKNKQAWNKGIKFEDTTVQQAAAARREERYKSGELARKSTSLDKDARAKISASVKEYARTHRAELQDRAKKAYETKREKGYNLAFFQGKTHSTEAKLKISGVSKKVAERKREQSINNMVERLSTIGFDTTEVTDTTLTASCNTCGTKVTYTKQMFQPSKILETLCRVCHPRSFHRSEAEVELFEFVKTVCPDAISTYRFDSTRRSLDVFVPSKNVGIEFNGLYYHSEQVLESLGYSKTKDFEKLKDVTKLGIRLIQVFEDEWELKSDIVKQRLLHILGESNQEAVYARKCRVKEINSREASDFCKKHHLQGHGRSNIRLGLFYNDRLVSVMTFSKSNLSRKVAGWELNRYCTSVRAVGGASKLFKYFIDRFSPSSVVTYSDRRWSVGNLYEKIGFRLDGATVPGYWYVAPGGKERIHRFALRKTASDSPGLTERQLRSLQGYSTVWDSGNHRWVWNAPI